MSGWDDAARWSGEGLRRRPPAPVTAPDTDSTIEPLTQRVDSAALPPVIQYWDTKEVPGYITELASTVTDRNPGRRHLMFDKLRAEDLIAEYFTDRELAAFRTCAVPAMQADYFRYCAICALGGVYVDADMRCVAPMTKLVGPVGGRMFRRAADLRVHPRPYPTVINHLFAFDAPDHPLMRLATEIATVNIERRVAEDVWAVTGPGIFTGLRLLHTLGSEDAFIERFGRDRGGRPPAETICEVVGGPARASAAFAGIAIGPVEEMSSCLQVVRDLPYKRTHVHWMHWGRGGASIYRD